MIFYVELVMMLLWIFDNVVQCIQNVRKIKTKTYILFSSSNYWGTSKLQMTSSGGDHYHFELCKQGVAAGARCCAQWQVLQTCMCMAIPVGRLDGFRLCRENQILQWFAKELWIITLSDPPTKILLYSLKNSNWHYDMHICDKGLSSIISLSEIFFLLEEQLLENVMTCEWCEMLRVPAW